MFTFKLCSPLHLLLFVAVASIGSSTAQVCPDSTEPSAECQQCHTCKVPTLRNVCLKDMPDAMVHHADQHRLSEAPDTILLNQLVGLYPPICFNHKQHAEMAEMSDSCSVCHHYSPEGTVPPCRECHPADPVTATGDAPLLQAAYHQQCRNCHTEWTGESNCQGCHEGAEAGVTEKLGRQEVDSARPLVHVPISKVYATPMTASPIVTFQHVEHIELFQFRCTECHTHESCSNCHKVCATGEVANAERQVRVICTCCHQDADAMSMSNTDCRKCHETEEKEPKLHEIVGKELPDYLKDINCESCHQGKK